MQVFILGGTGSLGTAVTRHLVAKGHQVTGLTRSLRAAEQLNALGARAVSGDMRTPGDWTHHLTETDAVVHLAATFDDQMADADAAVVEAVVKAAQRRATTLRVLYTGGCWLYGNTGNQIIHETTTLRPIAAFDFMRRHYALLQRSPNLSVAVLHPALVYHGNESAAEPESAGAFARLIAAAQTPAPVEIWGSIHTRWPLVERDDLASAYALILPRLDLTGPFNIAAEEGVAVKDILQDISQKHGHDGSYIVRDAGFVRRSYGVIAEGPMLDQRMSAAKLKAATGWQPQITDFRLRNAKDRQNQGLDQHLS